MTYTKTGPKIQYNKKQETTQQTDSNSFKYKPIDNENKEYIRVYNKKIKQNYKNKVV